MTLASALLSMLGGFLVFEVPQRVVVEERRIGAVYRLCQLCVLLYLSLTLYLGDTWAYTEQPVGDANAWPEGGSWTSALDNIATLKYCTGGNFSYAYDENFLMECVEGLLHNCCPSQPFTYGCALRIDSDPQCEGHHPYDVSSKGPMRVEFVTAFIEIRKRGWGEGGAASDAAERALCTMQNGTVTTRELPGGGAQAECTAQRTVYPVGVEKAARSGLKPGGLSGGQRPTLPSHDRIASALSLSSPPRVTGAKK